MFFYLSISNLFTVTNQRQTMLSFKRFIRRWRKKGNFQGKDSREIMNKTTKIQLPGAFMLQIKFEISNNPNRTNNFNQFLHKNTLNHGQHRKQYPHQDSSRNVRNLD